MVVAVSAEPPTFCCTEIPEPRGEVEEEVEVGPDDQNLSLNLSGSSISLLQLTGGTSTQMVDG